LSEAARLRQARASPAFTPRAVFHEPASSGPPTLSLHDALPISHPISLDVGSVGVGGGEDAADDQGGFEAEDVALVSVAQEWKTSEQARGAGARLDRGAREAEALLGVVAHPGEAQTVPYVLLSHGRQQSAEVDLD